MVSWALEVERVPSPAQAGPDAGVARPAKRLLILFQQQPSLHPASSAKPFHFRDIKRLLPKLAWQLLDGYNEVVSRIVFSNDDNCARLIPLIERERIGEYLRNQ